jgi:hypothetical protein
MAHRKRRTTAPSAGPDPAKLRAQIGRRPPR